MLPDDWAKRTRTQKGYSNRWARASKRFLRQHPLCRHCEQQGRVTPATETDHIKPHRGDTTLFWDQANWQPLCKPCHSRKTVTEDRTGHVSGCDSAGNPLDPNSHWHS